jgi:hypothetical protein
MSGKERKKERKENEREDCVVDRTVQQGYINLCSI